MNRPDDLVGTWIEAFASTSTGWDFSSLSGAMDEPEPPWSFDRLSVDALAGDDSALDMGTGGGEQLIRLVEALRSRGLRCPALVATEGWPPNVPVATANLAPYGIPVQVYDADTGERMPFCDESFAVVLNRHEAYSPTEVHRVLRPQGRFLTQQVGSLDARETTDWFGRHARPEWTLDRASTTLQDAGLTVVAADDFVGAYRFDSVTTLLRYFALVPWDLPDGFAVTDHLPALTALHLGVEAGKPVELTLHRWYVEARR
ncbi:class I SAM-dependent methyltransferase [Humibacillus sp. DSM 29435]|uniref:class I SAM-dependent methyltransferase n=1 Tax=Humibacillus sp. DSM 29435 TaxID=1869167 RepID=UPI0009F69ECB|nr:methyltransferase domain-containing protein [Humibacillus sp. DSM 29435]